MKKGLLLLATLMMSVGALQAACMNHTILEGILKANVDNEGFVDYDAIRIGKGGDLYEYLSFLEDADLKDCNESDKMAFWINAYNATMIKKVLARPNLKKVSEDFGLFDEPVKIARQHVSLNDIEHRILRSDPEKGGPIDGLSLQEFDPRVHFALVCAAIDCPRLLKKAYAGNSLNAVLQANAVSFANSPKHLSLEDGRLVVSTLLKWYGNDFEKLGGVPAYLRSLTEPSLRPDAKEIDAKLMNDFPDNVTFKYDWTLNSVRNKPTQKK